MDAKFCAQAGKTLSELREMGFTEEQISKVGNHEDVDLETSPKSSASRGHWRRTRLHAHGYQDQVRDVL